MIPGWAQLIGIAIAAGAMFWAGDQYGTNSRKLDRERASWSEERSKAAEASAEKEREYRATEQKWRDGQRQSMEIAHAEIDRLQDSIRRAGAASISLRSQFSAFVSESTRAAEEATTESERQAARARSGMSAQLFGEVERLAGIYAGEADRYRIAGLACEREHALTD